MRFMINNYEKKIVVICKTTKIVDIVFFFLWTQSSCSHHVYFICGRSNVSSGNSWILHKYNLPGWYSCIKHHIIPTQHCCVVLHWWTNTNSNGYFIRNYLRVDYISFILLYFFYLFHRKVCGPLNRRYCCPGWTRSSGSYTCLIRKY